MILNQSLAIRTPYLITDFGNVLPVFIDLKLQFSVRQHRLNRIPLQFAVPFFTVTMQRIHRLAIQ